MVRKKVLIPAFAAHPDIERSFVDAGFEVEFALGESERSRGRWIFDRADAREAEMNAVLEAKLPDASVLSGIGVKGHLFVTADMIARATKLETIYVGAAGFDRVDLVAATRHGVLVFNAPGGNSVGVAEHALGLMLSLTRRIDATARFSRRTGNWARQFVMVTQPPISVLCGKTLGLVGFGFIGRQLADRARRGLGMNVIAFDPFYDALEAERQGVRLIRNLDEMLAAADFISIHVPLNKDTKGLIGPRQFAAMKPSAYFINTARGPIVDTAALVAALDAQRIAGAGLDCVDPEPLPDGHPLFQMENVIVTPHIGGAAPEDIERADYVAARLALDFMQGYGPRYAVNPGAWTRYRERFPETQQ